MPEGLTRRSFLLSTGAAAVLAACGGDDDGEATADPSTTTATTAGATGIVLGPAFDAQGLLVTGIEQRLPFVLFESTGGLLATADAPAELTFDVDGEAITVARHGDDIARAYYPLVHTFAEPGSRGVRTTIGSAVLEREVNVNAPTDVRVPQVGDALPSAATPTTADPLGVQTVCTQDPPCPFHEVSLDAALAEGRPVALLVSTPAYCQVAICGPTLDLLIDGVGAHPDIAVVHLEVYPDGAPEPDGSNLSPLVGDPFGLDYEPVLFVAGPSGTITARLDNIYDSTELDAALRTV